MKRRYKVVDVFTSKPLLGNPVAVVIDAEGLDAATMAAVARWTNLSETTFLLPPAQPGADYRLRIFTPGSELPFAGHPTLGSAHAALEAGVVASASAGLVQECAAGLVPISQEAGRLSFVLPKSSLRSLTKSETEALEQALGAPLDPIAPPALVDVGPKWIIAPLESAGAVLDLAPDMGRTAALERRLGATGVTVFGAHRDGEAALEVRSFAPSDGIMEDPVCGSGNGAVAVFRRDRGLTPKDGTRYLAAQGRKVGRDGRVEVSVSADGVVSIGGACVTCVDGLLEV